MRNKRFTRSYVLKIGNKIIRIEALNLFIIAMVGFGLSLFGSIWDKPFSDTWWLPTIFVFFIIPTLSKMVTITDRRDAIQHPIKKAPDPTLEKPEHEQHDAKNIK